MCNWPTSRARKLVHAHTLERGAVPRAVRARVDRVEMQPPRQRERRERRGLNVSRSLCAAVENGTRASARVRAANLGKVAKRRGVSKRAQEKSNGKNH